MDLELHPQQVKAFNSPATEILYGGSAGGGKSHLMRVASIVWCSQIDGLQAYIFRRLSDDLYKNHMAGPSGYLALLSDWIDAKYVKYNASRNYIDFLFNGSRINLCHCQHEQDVYKYDGAEIGLLLMDELTHFTSFIYKFLRGRCRLSGGTKIPTAYKGLFPRIVSGSNPGGIGHGWVKADFIDIAPPLEVTQMPKEEGGMRRQFIPARLSDNPTLLELDPDYEAKLMGLGDPTLVRAKLEGDWNIVAGGALDDVWNSKLIVKPFKVPSNWKVDRSFDWGSAHPFSVGWWAESNGEEIEFLDGTTGCFRAGDIIQIAEWYGAADFYKNEGLKISAREIAMGIKEKEALLLEKGIIERKPIPGPADNQINNINEKESDSIASHMKKQGIMWTSSDKSKGSRKIGLELVRGRMKATKNDEPNGIYFVETCRASISTLPILPRDKYDIEDVDTDAIDHAYDMVRYRCLDAKRRFAKGIKVEYIY